MNQIIEALQRDHANFEKLLAVLEEELAIFDSGERPDYDVVLAIAEYFADYPQCCHHPLEIEVFNRLAERDRRAAEGLEDLVAEHEETAWRATQFKEAVEAILKEAEIPRQRIHEVIAGFVKEERQHIAKEENRFYPAALEALYREDWEEIAAAHKRIDDPVFSKTTREAYQALAERILEWEKEDKAQRG